MCFAHQRVELPLPNSKTDISWLMQLEDKRK